MPSLWPQLPACPTQTPGLLLCSQNKGTQGPAGLWRHGQPTLLSRRQSQRNLGPSLATKPRGTGQRSHNHIKDSHRERREHGTRRETEKDRVTGRAFLGAGGPAPLPSPPRAGPWRPTASMCQAARPVRPGHARPTVQANHTAGPSESCRVRGEALLGHCSEQRSTPVGHEAQAPYAAPALSLQHLLAQVQMCKKPLQPSEPAFPQARNWRAPPPPRAAGWASCGLEPHSLLRGFKIPLVDSEPERTERDPRNLACTPNTASQVRPPRPTTWLR